MEEFKEKLVVYSRQYALDTDNIFTYGTETFGETQAIRYENFVDKVTLELCRNYWMYPECKWLSTKGRIYRNIILDSHLIIYRIKTERIEVLRIFHSHSSITRIRSARSTKL